MKKAGLVIVILVIIAAIIAVVVFVNGGEKPTAAQEANTSATEGQAEISESSYKVEFEGKDLTPDAVFTQADFGEPQQFSEIPSCAFEGTDKVYNYGSFEVTTYQDGDQEKVYSVYFIDDQIATPEGVKIADDISAMTNAYGENYVQNESQYVYTSGNVELEFLVENDIITSITYTLVTE